MFTADGPFALLLGWGRWCAGAGTGCVTSGKLLLTAPSPPRAVGTFAMAGC